MSAPRALVALVTDFGVRDSYVAEVHLAARSIVPEVTLLDVAHDLVPFDVPGASLVAERTLARLPRRSALVVVVDPGVGTKRRRLAIAHDGRWLVGPDNGVLPWREGDVAYEIDASRFGPRAGFATFDGREVFVPVATRLAAGLEARFVGRAVTDAVPCVIGSDAEWVDEGGVGYARGVVIANDRFGNAVTNVRARPGTSVSVIEPREFAGPLRDAYGDVPRGGRLALSGSSGRIELAVREGAASVAAGTRIEVTCVASR